MISSFLESFGIDITTWLLLLVIAWYLFRGARAGKRVGSVFSRVITYTVLILVTGAIAAALGWANLDVAAFVGDASAAFQWITQNGIEKVQELIKTVLP